LPMPAKSKKAPPPDQFLADYPSDVQAAANALRDLIKQTIPGVIEAVYSGWQLIGYRVKQQKREVYIGFVAPKFDQVLLGFEFGALIDDPDHLLQGTGKQVRQIPIKDVADIQPEAFAALIKQAVEVAFLLRDQKLALIMEREAVQKAENE